MAFQLYEHEDMLGLVTDEHVLLRTLKVKYTLQNNPPDGRQKDPGIILYSISMEGGREQGGKWDLEEGNMWERDNISGVGAT